MHDADGYKRYDKCYLFFGSDGHGVASGTVSYEIMLNECGDVKYYSKFPDTTDPKKFWKETYRKAIDEMKDHKSRCHIVVVDIPLDVSEPEAGIEAIKEMRKYCDVTFIDHHRIGAEELDELVRSGARVIISPTARMTFYSTPGTTLTKDQLEILRLGAICDRDVSVLPITEEEEKMAYGLDKLVRPPYNPMYAFEVLRKRDWDRLREEGEKLIRELDRYLTPDNVDVKEEYVFVREAPANLRFKLLDRASSKYGKPYAVSYTETIHRVTKEPVALITVITNWRSGAVAIGKKLDLDKYKDLGCEVFGHDEALTILCPVDKGEEALSRLLNDPALKTRGWVEE